MSTTKRALGKTRNTRGSGPSMTRATPRRAALRTTLATLSAGSSAAVDAPPVGRKTPKLPPKRLLSFAAGLQSLIEADPLPRASASLSSAVTFTVLPRTRSGRSVQQHWTRLQEFPSSDFRPDDNALPQACDRLKQLGFEVVHVGRFGISVRGPARLVAEVSREELLVVALPELRKPRSLASFPLSDAGGKPHPHRLFLAPRRSLAVAPAVSETIDHFVFTPPPLFFGKPSAQIPKPGYHHLHPDDLRRLLQVPPNAPSGAGIRLAIVDSGFYPHPYYAANGFTIDRVAIATAPPPDEDSNGHGTAITLNALAVAPQATILAVPHSNPPQDALEAAFYDNRAQIISCSWGWDHEQALSVLELTIRDIVQDGGIVLFAAGNGHYAWPGSMPDVISVGGVYADEHDQLQASNYASGYMSSHYPNRRVPDVSGLCGQLPHGIYIPMPTQPGSEMDEELGGKSFDDFDETGQKDGWCVASGTSSATPQAAGVAALLLSAAQAKGQTLTTGQVRKILTQTAVSIQTGNNAFGFPASGQPNVAVGYGLINAGAALTQLEAAGPQTPAPAAPVAVGAAPGAQSPSDNPAAQP